MSMNELQKQTNANIQAKANLIWEIATHLVGLFKPHEYGKVILPMTVLKRFDDALKPTKTAVVEMAKKLDAQHIEGAARDGILCRISGYDFYNTSNYDFSKLISDPDGVELNFEAYLQGFSSNIKDIIANFDFTNTVKLMVKGGVLFVTLQEFTDEYINAVIGQGRHDNQSFFAFTATPKEATLESFGTEVGITPDGKPIKEPFHVYSMQQAIEEGYILDVLANYTTVKEAFKLIRVSEDNPELIEGQASRALFKYYKQHGYTIAHKTEMIMTNFLENCRYQINGKGKAMVVADSRSNAVRYYLAIKKYLADHARECVGSDVMIAFSGEVTLDDYPSEKPFTEATMNLDENGKYITTDKKFRKVFHSSQYNILVVANKYQTGFDEPLLHTMYVDKKLRDVTAVQTLSRLNRTTPGKNSTFVLDFENMEEDIKGAFLPYYTTTMLEGNTDLNRVYDFRNKIRDFMLYNFEDVETFNQFMAKQTNKSQDAAALGRLSGMFRPVIARYMDLSENDRYTLRDYVRKFNKAYAFVTQLVRLHDRDLFNEYQYTLHLIRLLPRTSGDEFVDIEDKIKLEYASLTETFRGAITLDEKPPAFVPSGSISPKVPSKKKDTLQSIIDKVNERFSGNFTDAD